MPIHIQKLFFLFFISLLFANCTSVEKYNQQLAQPIAVEKLQKDINYTQKKLLKLYPNLYGYIAKEKFNAQFDSIRGVLKPMTSKEFYFLISPIIASVRQGHMSMTPAFNRISKKEAKRLKIAGDGPLSQFIYQWQDEKLYITGNKTKTEKIKKGTEIVSVNQISPQTVFNKYRKSITSDGFNTTFIPKYFSKRYVPFMTNEIGINDSLTFVLKLKDSVFTQVVSRNKPVKKVTTKSNDSIKTIAKVAVDKAKIKAEKKRKDIYGYDDVSKEYVKNLRVVASDSSVAVLKIKNFSAGNYKVAYEEIFDSIKKANIKTLVIDIRDNPGGRVNDVVNLYSYLTNENYTLLKPAKVTSKTSLWKSGIFSKVPKLAYPLLAVGYPVYMGFSYFKTTKNSDGSYQYKLNGSKPRKSNPLNFKGKIYVLINGGSFSASCILSNALKANKNITFVGEETGGNFNGTVAGIMPVVTLPNSKILLRLGLMDIQHLNQTESIGRGIFPDKEIIPTIQNKIDAVDVEMNWILEDVKN